ncbi:MAG: ROK family protein [Candidatus Omnitrophica bacterium]|nr:ROK family protein [Candidatus Omnitrophota bacterium]
MELAKAALRVRWTQEGENGIGQNNVSQYSRRAEIVKHLSTQDQEGMDNYASIMDTAKRKLKEIVEKGKINIEGKLADIVIPESINREDMVRAINTARTERELTPIVYELAKNVYPVTLMGQQELSFKKPNSSGERRPSTSLGPSPELVEGRSRTASSPEGEPKWIPVEPRRRESVEKLINIRHPSLPEVRIREGKVETKEIQGLPMAQWASQSGLSDKEFLEQSIEWTRRVAEAVSLLHRQGVEHGDITPWNIIIDEKTNNPVLIDFGDEYASDIKKLPSLIPDLLRLRVSMTEDFDRGLSDEEFDSSITDAISRRFGKEFTRAAQKPYRSVDEYLSDLSAYSSPVNVRTIKNTGKMLQVIRDWHDQMREAGTSPWFKEDVWEAIINPSLPVSDVDVGKNRLFVAEENGKIKGALLARETPAGVFIAPLEVTPEDRRSGVGTMLIEKVKEAYPKAAIYATPREDKNVQDLFARLGFVESTNEKKKPFWELDRTTRSPSSPVKSILIKRGEGEKEPPEKVSVKKVSFESPEDKLKKEVKAWKTNREEGKEEIFIPGGENNPEMREAYERLKKERDAFLAQRGRGTSSPVSIKTIQLGVAKAEVSLAQKLLPGKEENPDQSALRLREVAGAVLNAINDQSKEVVETLNKFGATGLKFMTFSSTTMTFDIGNGRVARFALLKNHDQPVGDDVPSFVNKPLLRQNFNGLLVSIEPKVKPLSGLWETNREEAYKLLRELGDLAGKAGYEIDPLEFQLDNAGLAPDGKPVWMDFTGYKPINGSQKSLPPLALQDFLPETKREGSAGSLGNKPSSSPVRSLQETIHLAREKRDPDAIRKLLHLATDYALSSDGRQRDMARQFIEDTGHEIGLALRAFAETYKNRPFTETIVLGEGVGENFGNGVVTEEGKDLFIEAIKKTVGPQTEVRRSSLKGGERVFYAFVPKGDELVVGLDVGGTNLRVAILDKNGIRGEIKKIQWEFKPTPEANHQYVLATIMDEIRRISKDYQISEIGISWAGPGDYEKGIVTAPNIPGFDNFPLKEALVGLAETGKPSPGIRILHDGAAGAVGEYKKGSLQGEAGIYLILGTGIGAGIVDKDGNPVYQIPGVIDRGLGELGHYSIYDGKKYITRINRDGSFPGLSGNEKTFEQRIGGPALALRFGELVSSSPVTGEKFREIKDTLGGVTDMETYAFVRERWVPGAGVRSLKDLQDRLTDLVVAAASLPVGEDDVSDALRHDAEQWNRQAGLLGILMSVRGEESFASSDSSPDTVAGRLNDVIGLLTGAKDMPVSVGDRARVDNIKALIPPEEKNISVLKNYVSHIKDAKKDVELTAAVQRLLETLYPLEPVGQLEMPFPTASSPMIKEVHQSMNQPMIVLRRVIEAGRPAGEIIDAIKAAIPGGQYDAGQLSTDVERIMAEPAVLRDPRSAEIIPALSNVMEVYGSRVAERLMEGRSSEPAFVTRAEASMRMVREAVHQGDLSSQEFVKIIKEVVPSEQYEAIGIGAIGDDIVTVVQKPEIAFDKDLPALMPIMEKYGWDIAAKVKAQTAGSSPVKIISENIERALRDTARALREKYSKMHNRKDFWREASNEFTRIVSEEAGITWRGKNQKELYDRFYEVFANALILESRQTEILPREEGIGYLMKDVLPGNPKVLFGVIDFDKIGVLNTLAGGITGGGKEKINEEKLKPLFQIILDVVNEYGGYAFKLYTGDEVAFVLPSHYSKAEAEQFFAEIQTRVEPLDMYLSAGIVRADEAASQKDNVHGWFGNMLLQVNKNLDKAKAYGGSKIIVGKSQYKISDHEQGSTTFIDESLRETVKSAIQSNYRRLFESGAF